MLLGAVLVFGEGLPACMVNSNEEKHLNAFSLPASGPFVTSAFLAIVNVLFYRLEESVSKRHTGLSGGTVLH